MQNAIDAVRLRRLEETLAGQVPAPGFVRVYWDSVTRALTIDNGTGMSQEIIEKHLLNIGSSRYQDESFKRAFPGFSSISRFGIGILSTFMVSDHVEILTSHPDEQQARNLSIRAVHGRYLIRLIDKRCQEVAGSLDPRGTRIVVKLRPSAEIGNVLGIVRQWVVLPGEGITVTVNVDRNDPVEVGSHSLSEALAGDWLKQIQSEYPKRQIEIREVVYGNITLAYAVEYAGTLGAWEFLQPDSVWNVVDSSFSATPQPRLGTCVEGIRVDTDSAGYVDSGNSHGSNIVALANTQGRDAPKTTVARDGFEHTIEFERMVQTILRAYIAHASSEIERAEKRGGRSCTSLSDLAKHLVRPLVRRGHGGGRRPFADAIVDRTLDEAAVLLIERNGSRAIASANEIAAEAFFWTIDCGFSRWAEGLLRELPHPQSLRTLASSVTNGAFKVPDGCVLCVRESPDFFERRLLSVRTIDELIVDRPNRRVDLRWRAESESTKWLRWNGERFQIVGSIFEVGNGFALSASNREFVVPLSEVRYVGHQGEVAIRTLETNFLVPDAPFGKYVVSAAKRVIDHDTELNVMRLKRACKALGFCLESEQKQLDKIVMQNRGQLDRLEFVNWPQEEIEEILAVADITKWDVFDTNASLLGRDS